MEAKEADDLKTLILDAPKIPLVAASQGLSPRKLTLATVSTILAGTSLNSFLWSSVAPGQPYDMSAKASSMSEKLATQIDNSPSLDVGLMPARLLYVEKRWRRIVVGDWYVQGLVDHPWDWQTSSLPGLLKDAMKKSGGQRDGMFETAQIRNNMTLNWPVGSNH